MQNNKQIMSAWKAIYTILKREARQSHHIPLTEEIILYKTIAKKYHLTFLHPDQITASNVIYEFPYNMTLWEKALPIQNQEGCYWVLSNPQDITEINHICKLIQPAMPLSITCASVLYPLTKTVCHQHFYNIINTHSQKTKDNQIIKCVEHILFHAIEAQASDIHIEPQSQHINIRFRVNGLLQLITTLPCTLSENINSRIKILSELNITETRLPQDGRFHFYHDNQNYDCRISIYPTLFGEKTVIRILNSHTRVLSFQELGFSSSLLETIKPMIKKPNGLILVTGPTGSGKTQTLYTIIQYLQDTSLNISTIEDPIEIQIPGINQTNIKPSIGLNFSCILRALLRQDPDIIMLGEIRDQETAEIAIRSAQTGHLVLSTLHTNSAQKTLQRLINLGIEPYNLLDNINLIIAQRLIRILCPYCKQEVQHKEKQVIEQLYGHNLYHHNIFTATGCNQCQAGYKGRKGIFEVALAGSKMNHTIRSLNNKTDTHYQIAIQSLLEDGINHVKKGITSIHEIYRVTTKE